MPKYRQDAKGNIAAIKLDFVSAIRTEIQNGDSFLLKVEDANAFEEYSNYLTLAEMQACFKKAFSTCR
jgi:hypothetical protein